MAEWAGAVSLWPTMYAGQVAFEGNWSPGKAWADTRQATSNQWVRDWYTDTAKSLGANTGSNVYRNTGVVLDVGSLLLGGFGLVKGSVRKTVSALPPHAFRTAPNISGAKYAQRTYSEVFSAEGLLSGCTIDDVAGALRAGSMTPNDVPIDVILRDGHTLILNTRSSHALVRAGVPRSSWRVVDRTGQAAYEKRLTDQLARNGLTSEGTDLP